MRWSKTPRAEPIIANFYEPLTFNSYFSDAYAFVHRAMLKETKYLPPMRDLDPRLQKLGAELNLTDLALACESELALDE